MMLQVMGEWLGMETGMGVMGVGGGGEKARGLWVKSCLVAFWGLGRFWPMAIEKWKEIYTEKLWDQQTWFS